MKKTAIIMSVLCLAAVCARAQVVISDSDKARAAELVKQMTLEEKCRFIAGARSFSPMRFLAWESPKSAWRTAPRVFVTTP